MTPRRLMKNCHDPNHTQVAAFGFGAAFLQERLMIFANEMTPWHQKWSLSSNSRQEAKSLVTYGS